jgi:hypothetical protein
VGRKLDDKVAAVDRVAYEKFQSVIYRHARTRVILPSLTRTRLTVPDTGALTDDSI